jgi:hypothetical protein
VNSKQVTQSRLSKRSKKSQSSKRKILRDNVSKHSTINALQRELERRKSVGKDINSQEFEKKSELYNRGARDTASLSANRTAPRSAIKAKEKIQQSPERREDYEIKKWNTIDAEYLF